MMREAYDVLECKQCGAQLQRDQLRPGAAAKAIAEVFDKPIESLPLCHRRSVVIGSGVRGMIGSRMETVDCGPVELRTVSVQEQFVEWAGAKS